MNIKNVFKSTFFGSISILTFGSIIAQCISFALVPFITREYSPDQFATFTYILSVSAIFMGIINCRYDLLIVKAENKHDTYALIKGALFIGLFISFIIFIACIIIFSIKDNFKWYHAIYLLILLISYAIINVLTAYNNKLREYKIISSVNVIRPISQNLGALLLGFLPIGAHGLLFSYVTGQFMGIIRQNKSLKGQWRAILNISNRDTIGILKKNKNQLLYSTPAQLLNSLSYSSITIAIETLFGLTILGYYSLSVRLLGLPLSVISGNVSKVFYERAVNEYSANGSYRKSLVKTLLFLSILAVPMLIIMMWLIPNLCGLFFGQEWINAGKYIFTLAPMFAIRFIVTAVAPALIIVNKQKQELILQALFVMFMLISFILTKVLGENIDFFLTIISVLFSIGYICYLIKVIDYSKLQKI